MQKLIVYKTSDGKIHENINDAEKYADDRYGKALTSLAYQLVRGIDLKKPIERYNAIVDFLEAHLAEFVEVQKLKDDIKVVNEDEYEDGN